MAMEGVNGQRGGGFEEQWGGIEGQQGGAKGRWRGGKKQRDAIKVGGVQWKGYWKALEGDEEALNDSGSTLSGDGVLPHSCLQISKKQNVSSPLPRKDSILWEVSVTER